MARNDLAARAEALDAALQGKGARAAHAPDPAGAEAVESLRDDLSSVVRHLRDRLGPPPSGAPD